MSVDLDLHLTYGAFGLDVSFTTSDQGVTALFGPSGAGKSTIGQCIAGLTRPDRGHVSINGRMLYSSKARIFLPPEQRRVGMVFQDARLFPHLSVIDNLRYGLVRRRPDPTSLNRAPIDFDMVVGLLGLEKLLQRRPANLSGGERQRVALGRALLSGPEILVMDEPLAALDFARRAEILNFIAALKAEFALPIIYISHAIDEVARLADTMIVMDHGQVVAAGPVGQILSSPDLVGQIAGDGWGALIEGKVAGQDLASGLTEIAFPGGRIKVPPIAAALGHRVRLRIPARDVILALAPVNGLSVQNALPARIESLIEGPNGQVDVILALGSTQLVARVTKAAVQRLDLRADLPVYALIKSVAADRMM
jgi:molybdate transport system ATP-binding protein